MIPLTQYFLGSLVILFLNMKIKNFKQLTYLAIPIEKTILHNVV